MNNIKRYQTADKNRVFGLIGEAYGRQRAGAYKHIWDWLFINNPFLPQGSESILLLEEGDDLAGMVCNIFVDLKFNGGIKKVRWASFFIISNRYRGAGLSLGFYARDSQCYPLFAFPNLRASRFEKKSGLLKGIGVFKSKIRILSLFGIINKKINNKHPSARLSTPDSINTDFRRFDYGDTFIEEINDFDESFEAFWREVSLGYETIVVRNRKYLRWRFVESPINYRIFRAVDRDNRIKGYTVLRIVNNNGYIVDILTGYDDSRTIAVIFEFSVMFFKNSGCNLVECLIVTSSKAYARALFLNRFFISRVKVEFLGYSAKESELLKIRNLKNWFITAADPDLEMTNIISRPLKNK